MPEGFPSPLKKQPVEGIGRDYSSLEDRITTSPDGHEISTGKLWGSALEALKRHANGETDFETAGAEVGKWMEAEEMRVERIADADEAVRENISFGVSLALLYEDGGEQYAEYALDAYQNAYILAQESYGQSEEWGRWTQWGQFIQDRIHIFETKVG